MRKLLSGIAAVILLWAVWALLVPAYAGDGKVISINAGQGASSISRALKDAGVVHSALGFRLITRLTGQAGDLKAGDYEVPSGLNAFQTLDLLVSGKTLVHRFLVREGLNALQVAALLEAQGLGSAQRFLAIAQDPAQAARLKAVGPTLEGCLFPDSYSIARGMSEQAVVEMMVARFHAKVPASLLAQGEAIQLKPLQVLAMASLVEMEARVPEERPLVSAVYRNRMRRKMRLESDPTVRYALNKFTGPVLFKDLDASSDYNTYRHYGLPPGPICSPGLASIEAALKPAASQALFFVATADGHHVFSETYEEHLKAKAQFVKKRAAQRRKMASSHP